MSQSLRAIVLGVLAILCCATPSTAQMMPPEGEDRFGFLFSVGWSTLHTDGGSVLDNEDGWYFDSEILYRLKPDKPLWLGLGFAGSYFEADRDIDLGGGLFAPEVEVSADLGLFAIEPRLTYVVLPKEDKGLFLAGRLGMGLLIADQSRLVAIESGGFVSFSGDSDTAVAFEVRPAVQVGYSGGHWQVGGEFSYMWAWGDFEDLDSIEEARAGIFFRFSY